MLVSTFWIRHKPSDSFAIVECALQNKTVKVNSVCFIAGNVLDINAVRACIQHARIEFFSNVPLPTG